MAESFPRVSIIIPTYNRIDLLRQALAACGLQTWPEWEAIVVDDGSEEDVAAAVAEAQSAYGGATRRFVYVRQEKSGGNAARNNGFRHATGEFIQYLDSDDLLHPDKLECQVRHLAQRPDLDATIMLAEFFYEIPGDSQILWNVPARADMEGDLDRFLIEDAVWSPGGPLWRKAAVARIGGWDERLTCWQDWEFHVKALCAGITYCHENVVGYYHRDHQGPRVSVGSMTVAKSRACFLAGKLAYGYLKNSPYYDSRRYLLLEYFFLNLERLEKLQAPGKRRVRMDALWFMRRLACSAAQRAVLSVMTLLAGLPLLDKACKLYVNKLRTRAGAGSLRNVVKGPFLPPPPANWTKSLSENPLEP